MSRYIQRILYVKDVVRNFLLSERMPLKERISFIKRLSFLVRAGIPIIESLNIIRAQSHSPRKIALYNGIIDDIANGQYLSTSLSKHHKLFDDFSVHLIRLGETSGTLNQSLEYLVTELEKKSALKRKVVSALIYPLFITITTIGISALLTLYIFPKIVPIFVSLHARLPITTQVLMAVSEYLRVWGLLTLLIICILLLAYLIGRKTNPYIRRTSDSLLLCLPVVGTMFKNYHLANLMRTLGIMLKSGIPMGGAIGAVRNATTNRIYHTALSSIAENINSGEPLSRGFSAYPRLFPEISVQLIMVGEKTGNLSHSLLYLSELYESEVDDSTRNLSSTIEPFLMLFMGLIVGLIAVSIITPIYEITQHLQPR